MGDQSEEFDRLWGQAVEQHIAGLTDTDFKALVERTRPPRRDMSLPRTPRAHRAEEECVPTEDQGRANGGGPTIAN